MPIFHVTSPDGRTVEVTAPEGATEQQAIKYAQDNWETLSKSAPAKSEVNPQEKPQEGFGKKTLNVAENVAGSVVEPVLQQATGFLAKPIGEIAGLAATGYEALTGNKNSADMPQQFQQDVTQGLTYQPRTAAGQSILNPLNAIPAVVGGAVNLVSPEKPQDASTPGGMATNLVREAIPQSINILGAKLSPTEKELVAKQEVLNKQKVMNAPTDTIRDAMQKPDAQGLKFITPAEGGMEHQYSTINKQANPAISIVNEEAATRMAGKEVGIPEGQPFTPETIAAQKEKLNGAYSKLVEAAYGQLPPKPSFTAGKFGGTNVDNLQQTIIQTPEFRSAIEGEINRLKEVASGNPSAFKSLEKARPVLVDELKNMKQDPKSVLQRISLFREEAKSTFGKASPTKLDIEQARAQLFIANQLENLLEQNLEKTGRGELVPAMKESRKKLAQIHAVEDSLTIDGKVSIKKMAEIDKKTGGGLLTGNLKRIAVMGQKYPLGSLQVRSPVTHLSYFDAILGTASIAAGHPEGVALVAGKGLVPTAAKMGKLQTKTPDYVASPSKTRVTAATVGALTPAEVERQRRKKERAK